MLRRIPANGNWNFSQPDYDADSEHLGSAGAQNHPTLGYTIQTCWLRPAFLQSIASFYHKRECEQFESCLKTCRSIDRTTYDRNAN